MKKLFRTLLLASFALLLGACTRIDTGNVGVESTLGQVKIDELPPGMYGTLFKNVDEFTGKEVTVTQENLAPKSQDNLTMPEVDVDVIYKVNPGKVADLFIKYQGDVIKLDNGDKAVGYNRLYRETREAIYRSFAAMPATTMHTKRAELGNLIMATLQKELDTSDPGAFTITNVNMRTLKTDPAIEQAIQMRAQRDQEIEAKVKEIELEKGEAERKRVYAEGQAKMNRILAESLTPQLLELKRLEAQAAFAGQGTHTVLMGAGGGTLVNVGK
jgi:prohibitin 1